MNPAAKPMRTTLVFGLACGLLAFFLIGAARWTYFSHVLFQGLVWTCLAVYGILLARWSQTPLSRVVFPLALPLLLLLFHSPPQAFFLFCLVVLSWTRSGTCFPNTLAAGLATEIALCFGGAALVAFFCPRSALSWGLGIWLFFLVQSLFFLILARPGATFDESSGVDPFEQARRNAEEILGAGRFGG